MMPGANSLTDRASRWELQATPARALFAMIDAYGRLGYEVAPLIAAAGLRPLDREDPDAVVACAVYETVIERACQQRALPNMALRLAAETPIGAYPLLDYLVVASGSVSEGFRQLVRYLRLYNAPVAFELCEDEDPIRVVLHSPGNPFVLEYNISLAVLHFRRETEDRLRPVGVNLPHRPDDVAEFEQLLGCPVRPEAGWCGLELPPSSWRLPLRRRDPLLRGLLQTQADQIVAALEENEGLSGNVRRLLAPRMAGGDTRIEAIARELATSARTLQRRLADDGTSYQELLDETRRDAAERFLADSSLSVGEVGHLLGYSEPAAFHRAFKRWRGTTPLDFRRARRVPAKRRPRSPRAKSPEVTEGGGARGGSERSALATVRRRRVLRRSQRPHA